MYEIAVKETKQGPIPTINVLMDLMGSYFVDNHRWKIVVPSMPRFAKETLISGREFAELLKQGIDANGASFAPLEGDQILFRVTRDESWIIHTTRRHWMEFFEEKMNIIKKSELDPDLPEFSEFMQD